MNNSNVKWYTKTTHVCVETGEVLSKKDIERGLFVRLKGKSESRTERKDTNYNGVIVAVFIKHLILYYVEEKQQKLDFG